MPSKKALEIAMEKPAGGTFETLADHIDSQMVDMRAVLEGIVHYKLLNYTGLQDKAKELLEEWDPDA